MTQVEDTTAAVAESGLHPPAWLRDPSGLYPLRYWDGQQWTEHVSGPSGTSHDPLHKSSPVSARPATVPGGAAGSPGGARPTEETAGSGWLTDRTRIKVLAAGIGGGVVVVALVWGFTQYSTADKWRDRAEVLEHNLARADDSRTAVEERATQMSSENSDLAEEREALVRVVDYADEVNIQMGECLIAMDELVVEATSPSPSPGTLDQLYNRAAGVCRAAATVATQLQSEIGGLGL